MAMATKERMEAEQRAWDEWAERVARNHPDWNYYPPGTEPPKLPWWRRVLKL